MFIRYTSAAGVESTVTTNGDADRVSTVLRYIVDAHPGEPLFCLRGRDLLILPTIANYRHLATRLAVLGTLAGPLISESVLEAVDADYGAALVWATANPRLLKYPDRPVKVA